MHKLYTIGEALIDFTPCGEGRYARNAGGAPANVAVCAAKLGANSAIVSKLGEDMFGDYLINTLKGEGVDVGYISRTRAANTALAFVTLTEGERSFTFYRNPSADMLLFESDVEDVPFEKGDILHFGSVDLVDYPVRKAHTRAIQRARMAGATISFDPNLRFNLWRSGEELLSSVNAFLPNADVLKLSEDELFAIAGTADEEQAVKFMFRGEVKLIFVTRGGRGATVYTAGGKTYSVPAEKVSCVDSTGAGDCFTGTILFQLLRDGVVRGKLGECADELEIYLRTANRAAGLCVSRFGAIPAMPSYDELFGGK